MFRASLKKRSWQFTYINGGSLPLIFQRSSLLLLSRVSLVSSQFTLNILGTSCSTVWIILLGRICKCSVSMLYSLHSHHSFHEIFDQPWFRSNHHLHHSYYQLIICILIFFFFTIYVNNYQLLYYQTCIIRFQII